MFPNHKTKIICTIGPASEDPAVLEDMLVAGMNVARLNFSHGTFESHRSIIASLREASRATGRRVAIMGDLPGPKIRIGSLEQEPIQIEAEDTLVLTTDPVTGDANRVAVSFDPLPRCVKIGDRLFLNDGIIALQVTRIDGTDIHCRILVGGELRSRKGLNLPGIDLGISAFTSDDRAWLEFAAEQRIDAVSQSFVACAEDIEAVRREAASLNFSPFIIAKIERSNALDAIEDIFEAADGIMIARGDLGVEVPIERMAVLQKQLTDQANRLGKPVITATQMLHSMVASRRPTRAEATDVANAILDGTDCVMLSEESAMGRWPVESVRMLAQIAAETEPHQPPWRLQEALRTYGRNGEVSMVDLITLSVEVTLHRVCPRTVIVPTLSGATARNMARFRAAVWVTAFSPSLSTCQSLQFSYGVNPVGVDHNRADWTDFSREWLHDHGITDGLALLVQGPSAEHPHINHRMDIIQLRQQ
jgi:pyruvate kinase